MALENTFTGPWDYDAGQGNSTVISTRLVNIRDGLNDTSVTPNPGTPLDPDDTDHPHNPADEGQVIKALSSVAGSPAVFFRRGPGIVSQALMDQLLGPTAFPSWPDVDGFTLVYEPEWWPVEHADAPAFQVKRVSYLESAGGDYVRGSTVVALPNAVLKYQTTSPERRKFVIGQALLYVQTFNYDSLKIEWEWPVEEGLTHNWGEVALVRSVFGYPTTPTDGQTVFRSARSTFELEDGTLNAGPVIFDEKLTGGHWYYYTLFFNISPRAPLIGDWVIGFSDSAQIPLNYRHADHLWNGLPPYYQWTDEQQRPGSGFLKQYFNIFGFELDFTRQTVEFMQDMYHIDFTPMSLLKQIGNNHGIVGEQGLGDIRLRAMIADLPERLKIRGTQKALEQTITTMSKYDSDISVGANLMLLPDDSNPFFSTGNWGGPHPTLAPKLAAITPPMVGKVWDQVDLTLQPADVSMPGVGESGYMRINAATTGAIIVTCGSGMIDPPVYSHPENTTTAEGEYIPLTNGIPVEAGGVYGFAAYIRRQSATINPPRLVLMWFGKSGAADALIAGDEVDVDTPGAGSTITWFRETTQGVAPVGAYYLVPGIWIENRTSASHYVDMTGAMVYLIQAAGAGPVPTPSNNLLTVGDPAEKIGKPGDPGMPGGFVGRVIGEPIE